MVKKDRKFDGKKYRVSAATRKGVPKYDAKYNQRYLKKMGFKTRVVKTGGEWYCYARK